MDQDKRQKEKDKSLKQDKRQKSQDKSKKEVNYLVFWTIEPRMFLSSPDSFIK